MEIKVTEKCKTETGTGIRTVIYNSSKNNLKEASEDYEKNFNIKNVISSGDDFEDECLSSEIENIEKACKPCWIDNETKICSFWGEVHGGDFCHLNNEELTEEEIAKGCMECQY